MLIFTRASQYVEITQLSVSGHLTVTVLTRYPKSKYYLHQLFATFKGSANHNHGKRAQWTAESS